MKGVKLTERIRYMHCEGDDGGSHGVLVLLSAYGYPTKMLEVNDQADFRFAYSTFVAVEEKQAELNRPAKQLVTV
jgi:hypothetical protein